MRKRPLITALILLLLIGGGAAAFYFHLRHQARPQFSELNHFLLQELPPSEWQGANAGEYPGEIFEGPRWLDHLGVDRSKEAVVTQYIFSIPQDEHSWIHLDVIHADDRVTWLYITPISADHDERFRRMILKRYPRLEPIFKVGKGGP